ncbi:response regulator [Streptomyces tauricus]|uniref:response regulator n=1 Tax=Streptomyces tauricus TaxID=68274 RepID=UPI0022444A46|nr:response regulator transcription factor [Streptomyces tauricus]MCW8103510.1 response regulator transcription factor [Streptomyces tauricus]
MSVSVVIADENEMARMVFRLILESEGDISVIGEASGGVEAIEMVGRLRPKVCLINIHIPTLGGLEATRKLRQWSGEDADLPKIVLVTNFDLDEHVYDALRAGADGFVVRNSGPRPLIEAVRAAVDDDSLISPSMTVRLFKHLGSSLRAAEPVTADARRLTSREREIVHLLAQGCTDSEIAQQTTLAASTVKGYLSRIQRKLPAPNRVGIAAWAWEHGMVG